MTKNKNYQVTQKSCKADIIYIYIQYTLAIYCFKGVVSKIWNPIEMHYNL